jgi:anti-sigma B factor antagonist
MRLTEISAQPHPILKIDGELDLLQAPALRSALEAHAARRSPVLILDLSDVPFMDSSALSELMAYQQSVLPFGGKLLIAAPCSDVRELFTLAKLYKFFRVFDSTQEACAAAPA